MELSAITINKRYGHRTILEDISCVLQPAKITVIVGPSGCGKSTLLRHLSFLEQPDDGEVSLILEDERFISGQGNAPWPHVTCVFQKQFLWPHLTIRENILLPLRSCSHFRESRPFDQIVEMFAMAPFLDRYPNEVSGGEAQRAALARAFALAPQFILLDEAHTFLDMEQQWILNSYITELAAKGIGFAIVSHSFSFIKAHADHIIVIEHGRIVEQGDQEILKAPQSLFLQNILKRI